MNVADFDYDLPARFIAQTPAQPRDSARLLHLDRRSGRLSHHIFSDIVSLLAPNDVLVLNNTRVIPARLFAHKAETGGAVEILLLKRVCGSRWEALVGGRNVRAGTRLAFENGEASCLVVEEGEKSQRLIEFDRPVETLIHEIGEMPLPPYIQARLKDSERYQTVYSEVAGSAAAPTAGLHFTPTLLGELKRSGVRLAHCTLHIGLDTFLPVAAKRVADHRIHSEYARLDAANAAIVNETLQAGGRIIAAGTTSARALETAAILGAGGDPARPAPRDVVRRARNVLAFEANTRLFIYPGYQWRVVDSMISNFHLPKSTLLMMISAFAGREILLNAYETAKRMNYRFYSFGDAMIIT